MPRLSHYFHAGKDEEKEQEQTALHRRRCSVRHEGDGAKCGQGEGKDHGSHEPCRDGILGVCDGDGTVDGLVLVEWRTGDLKLTHDSQHRRWRRR